MKALVAVSSRHGGTQGIGERIAGVLRTVGVDAEVRAPDEVAGLEPYDAVIVGSAVYLGRWLPEARQFVERHAHGLRVRRTWLFSSGPLGDPVVPAGEPPEVETLATLIGARGRRVFAGSLAREALHLGERAMVRMSHAPYGDFRDWAGIGDWARQIAEELRTVPAAH